MSVEVVTAVQIAVGACWALTEVVLATTRRASAAGSTSADQGSFGMLWAVIIPALVLGISSGVVGFGRLPHTWSVLAIVGPVLVVGGLIIRLVAIATLKEFFTVDVAIHEGHRVVDTGVYRWVRHPAYSGNLVSFFGLGLSFCSWASTLIIFVPTCMAFLRRIHLEEAALEAALGEPYRLYQRRTKKLMPLVF